MIQQRRRSGKPHAAHEMLAVQLPAFPPENRVPFARRLAERVIDGHGGGSLRIHVTCGLGPLQISPRRLFLLDRFKQRFEITFAEGLATAALDNLEA